MKNRFSAVVAWIAGVVVSLHAIADCEPLPAGLVGWWRGDGVLDQSTTRVGTQRGSLRIGEGKVGSALILSGFDSGIQLPAGIPGAITNLTIEGWIRRAESNRASLEFEGGEFLAGSAGGLSFGLTHDGRLYVSHIGFVSFYSTTRLADTNWHHVAVTRAGKSLNFYADGALNSTVACPANFDFSGAHALGGLGSMFNGSYFGFLGALDEFAFYSRDLSASEIQSIFDAGADGKCPSQHSIPVVNSSFENLTGTNRIHFDEKGALLPGHYSETVGFPLEATGFASADPIPGWKAVGSSGTANYQATGVNPSGISGQLVAWINGSGTISQALPAVATADTVYTLLVDVTPLTGVAFPGFSVGLFADGTALGVATDSVVLNQGTLTPIVVRVAVPASSSAIGKPLEIRLGTGRPGANRGQVVFDNVRLIAESLLPVPCAPAPANLEFELGGIPAGVTGPRTILDSTGRHFASADVGGGPGKVGMDSLQFGGSTNFVAIPDFAALDQSSFSIEGWVNPGRLTGALPVLVSKEAGPNFEQRQFAIGIKGPVNEGPNSIPIGNLAFSLGGVTGLPNDYNGWVDSRASVPTNTWSHFALVVSPQSAVVYFNGVATRRTDGLSGTLRVTPGALMIGNRGTNGFFRDPFAGGLDELSFYSRALSAGEIVQIFAAGSAGKCDTLIPVLISYRSGSVGVSWPDEFVGAVLQTSASAVEGSWATVPKTVVHAGGRSVVTLSTSEERAYFRVRIE